MKWLTMWIALGIIGSVIAGIVAAPAIGSADATIFALLLTYEFLLTVACMRICSYLIDRYRPSLWIALVPATFCGIPMFLGWFPISSWMFDLGFKYGHGNAPSTLWVLAAMILGLLVPGGPIALKPRPTGKP